MSVQISSSVPEEVRRNRFTEPLPATSARFLAARGDVTFPAPGTGADRYALLTCTSTGGMYFNLQTAVNRVPVTVGETIQYSCESAATGGAGRYLRLFFMDLSGAILTNIDGPTTVGVSFMPTTVSAAVPAGAAFAGVYLLTAANNVGDQLFIRRVYAGAPGSYFDGGSPGAEWAGAANASESLLPVFPSTTPDLVLGWEQSRAGGAIAQDVIGGGVRIAVGMSRPRTGTLELFYKDEVPAVAAFDMHQHAATFLLSDLDAPGSWRDMRYVVTADGGSRIRLDEVTRRRWIVEVDYQEMQVSL